MELYQFIKDLIAEEFPNFELVDLHDRFEVRYKQVNSNQMYFGGYSVNVVMTVSDTTVQLFELLQLIPVDDDQIITSTCTRMFDIKETTNLMIYFSLKNVYNSYIRLSLRYKQWKEETKLEEIQEDFK